MKRGVKKTANLRAMSGLNLIDDPPEGGQRAAVPGGRHPLAPQHCYEQRVRQPLVTLSRLLDYNQASHDNDVSFCNAVHPLTPCKQWRHITVSEAMRIENLLGLVRFLARDFGRAVAFARALG